MADALRPEMNRTAQVEGGDNARRALFTAMAGIFASSQARGQAQAGPQAPVDRVRRDNLYYLVTELPLASLQHSTPRLFSAATRGGLTGS